MKLGSKTRNLARWERESKRFALSATVAGIRDYPPFIPVMIDIIGR